MPEKPLPPPAATSDGVLSAEQYRVVMEKGGPGPALEVWNVAAEDDRAFLRTTFTELRAKAMRRREEFGP